MLDYNVSNLKSKFPKNFIALKNKDKYLYVAKDINRDKGYKVIDQEQGLYSSDNYRYSSITAEKKENLYKNLNLQVSTIVKNIEEGEFKTQPKKFENCDKCYWRTLCRAPHLN